MRASNGNGGMMGLAVATVSGGIGFLIADGLDRFLATYNPSGEGEKPKDKFTSDGAGTLANTLNIASAPDFMRVGAGAGAFAVPLIASMYTRGAVKRGMQGATIGSGISLIKMLWNGFIVPLLKPKETDALSLQKSYIARLYPAEVAASVSKAQKPVSTGALSGGDVGPFALAADSPYPNAAESLRVAAGLRGPGSDFPTVQNTWGTGDVDYTTAAQALYKSTGVVGEAGLSAGFFDMIKRAAPQMSSQAAKAVANQAARQVTLNCTTTGLRDDQSGVGADWEPGPPPLPGPGPQAPPGDDPAACGCIGDANPFLGFIGDAQEETLYSQ